MACVRPAWVYGGLLPPMMPVHPTMIITRAEATDQRVCAWLRRRAAAPASTDGMTSRDGDELLVGVAMDYKTVRNTPVPGEFGGEVRLFSAMLHQEAVVLAQLRVPDGTNEITQVHALLAGSS